MSAIDLALLGIISEKPRSAYEIQKDVEYHHFSRWAKVSVPSIYRKVLQLGEKGYLKSELRKSGKFAEKTVYSLTPAGETYFRRLMREYAAQPVALTFDFNLVVSNLNKLPKPEALALVETLRNNLQEALAANGRYAAEYADIPLTGLAIIEQQGILYAALLNWLEEFQLRFEREDGYGIGGKLDDPV